VSPSHCIGVWGEALPHHFFFTFWFRYAYFGALSGGCGPSDEHTINERFYVNESSIFLLILVSLSELWAWGCSHVRPMVDTPMVTGGQVTYVY